jgi:hypothetical protein
MSSLITKMKKCNYATQPTLKEEDVVTEEFLE